MQCLNERVDDKIYRESCLALFFAGCEREKLMTISMEDIFSSTKRELTLKSVDCVVLFFFSRAIDVMRRMNIVKMIEMGSLEVPAIWRCV